MTRVKMLFVLNFLLFLNQEAVANSSPTQQVTKKTSVLFAHGFGGTKTRRLLYIKGYERFLSLFYNQIDFQHTATNYLFDREIHNVISFNFKDVQVDMGVYGCIPNPLTTHLAQHDDIKRLHENLEKITDEPIIGFGVSRGAATWITTLGSKGTTKNLAVVILESPFATVKNTYIHGLIGYFLEFLHAIIPISDPAQKNDELFQSVFQSHSLTGIQPLDVVGNVDKNIPILLVHSYQDAIIPIDQSRELYIRLKQAGHDQVYLLELEKGEHAGLIWGPQASLYRDVVHSLYKKCNVPFNEEFTKNINLDDYRPSIEEVQNRIKKNDSVGKPQKESSTENIFSTFFDIFM